MDVAAGRPPCPRAKQSPRPISSLRHVLARGGHGKHVSVQVQALLAHAHRVLRKLGGSQRRQLLAWLPPVPMAGKTILHTSVSAQILARLVGMSARTIDNHVNFVRHNGSFGKRPHVRPAAAKGAAAGTTAEAAATATLAAPLAIPVAVLPTEAAMSSTSAVRAETVPAAAHSAAPPVAAPARATAPAWLVNLVRVTQFMSTHGLPKSLLPNLAYLVAAAGGNIGPSRHHHRFASVAEAAARALRTRKRQVLFGFLGSTA